MKCKTCNQEMENDKWLKIPELGIKVEKEIHDKGKSWNELNLSKKEDQLLTVEQCIWLANSKYTDKLGMNKDEGFFIRQPFMRNKKKGYVAVFCHFGWVHDGDGPFSLIANWGGPDFRGGSVGVRSFRRLTKKKVMK